MKVAYHSNKLLLLLMSVIPGLVLACSSTPSQTVTRTEEVEVTRVVEVELEVTRQVEVEVEVTRIVEGEPDLSDTVLFTGFTGVSHRVNFASDDACNSALERAGFSALNTFYKTDGAREVFGEQSLTLADLSEAPEVKVSWGCINNVASINIFSIGLSPSATQSAAEQVREYLEASFLNQ